VKSLVCCAALAVINSSAAFAQIRSGTITLPDGTIPYEERGSGSPVVFIHGWTQNMSIWDEQVPVFERQ
jgi:3-oxoadipate enol-lactonase